MIAKSVVVVGLAGALVYAAADFPVSEPTVFDTSRDQAISMLRASRIQVPATRNESAMEIWSTPAGQGLTFNVRRERSTSGIPCRAVLTAVARDKTRVTAECGGPESTKSAIARTDELYAASLYQEYIESTLKKRPFDRKRVQQRDIGVTMENLNAMQLEALQRSSEEAKMLRSAR